MKSFFYSFLFVLTAEACNNDKAEKQKKIQLA